MDPQVEYCHLRENLAEASRKLLNRAQDNLPVCADDGRLVGILDQRSISLAARFAGRPLHDIQVSEVFVEDGPRCRVNDDPADVMQWMLQYGVGSLAVVDGTQRLAGQVSYATLLAASGRLETLVRLLDGSLDPLSAALPYPGWTYLTDRHELVSPQGEHRHLSLHESRLFACFADVPRKVVDRDYLMRAVCDRRWCPKDRYIDVLVGTLRRKLGECASAAKVIQTVHGIGYVFDAHVVGGKPDGRSGRSEPSGSAVWYAPSEAATA
jgi:DNA-binding winged helix-turn-helix (wHTH) protein